MFILNFKYIYIHTHSTIINYTKKRFIATKSFVAINAYILQENLKLEFLGVWEGSRSSTVFRELDKCRVL